MTRLFDPRDLGARCGSCLLGPRGACRKKGEPWRPVPNEHRDSSVACVAQMPGPEEEKAGYPFAGADGAKWREGLETLGLRREDVAILNEQFCKWPGSPSGARKRQDAKVRGLRQRAAKKEAARLKATGVAAKKAKALAKVWAEETIPSPPECCRPAFMKELVAYPHIIALGSTAAKATAGMTGGIHAVQGDMVEVRRTDAELRASGWDLKHWPVFDVETGTHRVQRVVPTFHPAYVARAPGAQHRWLAAISKSFRWFNDALTYLPPSSILQPHPDQLEAFLKGYWPDASSGTSASDHPPPLVGGRTHAGPEYSQDHIPPVSEWRACPWPIPFFEEDYETDSIQPRQCEVRCVGLATPDLKSDGRPALPGAEVAWLSRSVGIHFVMCKGGTGGLRRDPDAPPGRYYNARNEARIKDILRRYHAREDFHFIGHNFITYDGNVSDAWLGDVPVNEHDTLGHARAVNPEMPKGLKALIRQYLDIGNYETTEKGEKAATSEKVTDFERMVYCSEGDCAAGARVAVKLYDLAQKRGYASPIREDLRPAGWGVGRPWTLEEVDRESAYMCREMHINGQPVDRELVRQQTRKYEGKVADLRKNLEELGARLGVGRLDLDGDEQGRGDGTVINPGSYGQVRELLYDRHGLWCPPGMEERDFLTDTGLPGTGDMVLRAHLADPAVPKLLKAFIWNLRLERRYKNKYLATILRRLVPQRADPDRGVIWDDGRVHSHFSPWMAAPGRLASRNMNLQNLIKLLKVVFRVQKDPYGRTRYFLQADLSQAHLVIIANYWRIQSLLDGFLHGADTHGRLANTMYAGAYLTSPNWGERGAPPNMAAIMDGWKPLSGPALVQRNKAKTFRYTNAYRPSPETVLRVMQSTEVPLVGDDGQPVLDRHGIPKMTLPNIGMTLQDDVLPMIERLHAAEPEWKGAWQQCADDYHANGGWLESYLFKRRSGALSGGKAQETANYPALSTEADWMRLCEWRVRQAFPHQHHGPGTGMVSQVHDEIGVEWVGGKLAKLEDSDRHALANERSLGDGFVCHDRKYKWCGEVEDNRLLLEDCMQPRIPGWTVQPVAEAGVGMDLKEA